MTAALDPRTLPLWGSRLIEASAGTGKTWTITALFLRLVLGHGGPDAGFGEPLAPQRILVMTFTRAATRELSDRIRKRLVEAAGVFRDPTRIEAGDGFLKALVEACPDDAAREHAAWRLAVAAEAMDDAAVFTIDAWIQRMLHDHAFDSGSALDERLEPDEVRLLGEAARDYWREAVYPLTGDVLDGVLAVWKDVAALTADMLRLTRRVGPADIVDPVDASLLAVWQRVQGARLDALAELKRGWSESIAALRAWLAATMAQDDPPFAPKDLQPKTVDKWLAAIGDWAATPTRVAFPLTPAGERKLSVPGITDTLKPGRTLRVPVAFDAIGPAAAAVAALEDPAPALRRHAALAVALRLRQSKHRAGLFGFDDLLERLDAALAGPSGDRLRERIVAQYPVALIDEFQDTSPLQYRIFDRLYRIEANDRATALFLIGDPKQAIFAFRGADIRSYLRAREATAGRHDLLTTNHRSTAGLVSAINHLFEQAERRGGDGAFRFGPADASPLAFHPVVGRGRDVVLHDANGPVIAMTLCHDAELSGRKDAQHRFAERCAEHMAVTLNDAHAGFRHRDGGFARVVPADVTVLVRDRYEAAAMRRALARRDVPSVYLSDQDSVFASAEAADLVHWLHAVADPLDARRVRIGLATALIDLPMARLVRLAEDDVVFEAHLDDVKRLHDEWRRQGVLPMLRRTLHVFDLPARWLATADGDRKLTNYLHLAELLQAASARLDGEQALIRWLVEQLDVAGVRADEQIVRLESDADRVKVVTVHTAKGLEYPIVYLPFASSFRSKRWADGDIAFVVDGHGERRVVFDPDAEDKRRAELEERQEDLRLLYVALTRARHALWLGVAPLKDGNAARCGFHCSAFGYLVAGDDAVSADEIAARLHAVFDGVASIRLDAQDGFPARTRYRTAVEAPVLSDAPHYAGTFERDWSIGSFSAFVRDLSRMPLAAALVDPAVEEELLSGPREDEAAATANAPRHRFPRGALPGNFLHDQLEWLAAQRFVLADDPVARDQLARRCERAGLGGPRVRRGRLADRGRHHAAAADRVLARPDGIDPARDGVLVAERWPRCPPRRRAVSPPSARRPRSRAAAGPHAARDADGLRGPRGRGGRPVLGRRLQVERARSRRRVVHGGRAGPIDGRPSLRRAGGDLPAGAASTAAAAARRGLRPRPPARRCAVPVPSRRPRTGRRLPRRAGAERAARRSRRGARPRRAGRGVNAAAVHGTPHATMRATLDDWAAQGWLRRLDVALARFVSEHAPSADDLVVFAAAITAALEGQGHTCLAIDAFLADPAATLRWSGDAAAALQRTLASLPATAAAWFDRLAAARVVATGAVDEDEGEPLVLVHGRLYLRRYWRHEARVARQVLRRVVAEPPAAATADAASLRPWLDRLFDADATNPGAVDWQRVACAIAMRGRFTIVTGGPGTGKTFTAARFLALLASTAPDPARLRIALAAPTGKAAARLRQAIDAALEALRARLGPTSALPALIERIGPARTLHALLGTRPGTRRFRHDAAHPLEVDVVIVDEASMVQVEMMDALLDALPPHARVLLLGDKDQLASVEAGAVLGELCRDADATRYDAATLAEIERDTGQRLDRDLFDTTGGALAQRTVVLRRSQRFSKAIGALANAVNAGDAAAATRLLEADSAGAVAWRVVPSARAVVDLAVDGRPGAAFTVRDYLRVVRERPAGDDDGHRRAWILRVLQAFDRCRVLCAVRRGDWGVEAVNAAIVDRLRDDGLLPASGEWYEGRPVLVTRNDATLGVFNGDIGIALRTSRDAPNLRACFVDGADVRSVGVGRLGAVETAFAMTVHKSQGSEFEHTILVLPDDIGPVVTRELAYTGITRARRAFTLVSRSPGALGATLAQTTLRSSGLMAMIDDLESAARTP